MCYKNFSRPIQVSDWTVTEELKILKSTNQQKKKDGFAPTSIPSDN